MTEDLLKGAFLFLGVGLFFVIQWVDKKFTVKELALETQKQNLEIKSKKEEN